MSASISITEVQVFNTLRAWLQYIVGSTIQVVQEMDNDVPMPLAGFILMNCTTRKGLNTSVASYVDTINTKTVSNKESIDYMIQIDCYGPNAGDWVTMIASTWKTLVTSEYLATGNIKPLYNEDPHQVPFVDGEKQYEHRWLVVLHLQYNPMVTLTQEFGDAAEVESINVDRTYPA